MLKCRKKGKMTRKKRPRKIRVVLMSRFLTGEAVLGGCLHAPMVMTDDSNQVVDFYYMDRKIWR